jgi:VanZ family protein
MLGSSRLNSAQTQLLKSWIAATLWLGLIVGESTNYGSAENTSRFLYPLLHFLGVSASHFLVWHFFIRKTGHFVGYFTLSLLLFRAWRATFPFPGASWTMQWARISFFMTALVASLDEWHQTYLPKRTGTVHDVILDSTAALAAQILLFVILRARKPEPLYSQHPAQN